MLLVIRISGLVDMASYEEEFLSRLRLRRKYSAILMPNNAESIHTLKQLRNFVAYGEISPELLTELIEKRVQGIANKKVDAKKVLDGIGKKTPDELGIKPFFRLHPPRGGIDAKIHFGRKKGVLGDNGKAINDLLRRML